MPAKKKTGRSRKTPRVNRDYTPPENFYPPQQIVKSGPSNLLLILLIIVSFFAGYLFFKLRSTEQTKNLATATQPAQPAQVKVSASQIKNLFTSGYIHFGDASRKVLFVEITDPSCPYCHVAGGRDPEVSKQVGTNFQYSTDGGTYTPPVPEMKKLVDQGAASLAIVYSPGHGNGQLGMQALYCANEKGKFWDVHDLLMNNAGYDLLNTKVQNDKNNIPQLVDFLSNAVDPSFLKDCLESGKYANTLNRDIQVGQSLGFQGTPQFFVNTTPFMGAYDWKQIQPSVQL